MSGNQRKDDDLAEVPSTLKGIHLPALILALLIYLLPFYVLFTLVLLIPQILVAFLWEIITLIAVSGFLYWFHGRYNPKAIQAFWQLISLVAHQVAAWADKKQNALPPSPPDDPT